MTSISLDLKKQVGDERGQGIVIGQLATLAWRLGDLEEAHKQFNALLNVMQSLGDLDGIAQSWHGLAVVEDARKNWDIAEKYYKESLLIAEQMQNYKQVARVCNDLATLVQDAGRLNDAERWYLRTLEFAMILPEQGAKVYNNLAGLYLSQNRLDEAETYARHALAIKETLDLSSEPWKTYNILAGITEKRGRMDEAREWRRKEQESFAAFAGSDTQIKRFEPLIVAIVQAANGDEKAKAYLEDEYPKMQAGGERWINTSKAIQSIVAGERDFAKLSEGMDRETSLIIRRALQVLSGDGGQQSAEHGQSSAVNGQPTSPQPSPARRGGEEQQGVTLPQLLELVERAAGGDKELGGQLFTAFQQMARDENKEMSALGNVLLRVLIGEKNPSLDGLPDEVASAIRGMLGRLKNK